MYSSSSSISPDLSTSTLLKEWRTAPSNLFGQVVFKYHQVLTHAATMIAEKTRATQNHSSEEISGSGSGAPNMEKDRGPLKIDACANMHPGGWRRHPLEDVLPAGPKIIGMDES